MNFPHPYKVLWLEFSRAQDAECIQIDRGSVGRFNDWLKSGDDWDAVIKFWR